jgi:stage V sporulation protein B
MLTEEAKYENAKTESSNSVQRSLGAKIIRNVLFGGLRYILVLPIPFVMTPLILHKVGVAGYGTWAVFLAINGLTSLADLGLVGTLSKFVAQYYARQDFAALSRLVNSGLSLFLLIDLVIATSLWMTTPVLAKMLFHGSTVASVELVTLLRFFLIVIAANILIQLFASVTTGLQRLDLTNVMSAVQTVLGAIFGGILLLQGFGLRGLVYGYIASAIITVLAYLVLVRRLLPMIVLNPAGFDAVEAKHMLGFSLQLYLTQAAVAVHNQVEKVFLAMLVGVDPVGWYDIASDVALKARGSIGFILSPVLPAASELNALGDQARMRELYHRSHKYLALFGVPAVLYLAAISHRFVELWLGTALTTVALPLSVLVIVNFLNLATGPGFLILAGCGYMEPGVRSAMLGIVLNIVLSFALIYKFGFAGAVLGTSISLLAASGYFMVLFHRHTGYSVSRVLLESYLKPILISILILGAIFVIHPSSTMSWFALAASGLIFGATYSLVILLSGFFDDYDWTRLESYVSVARYARRVARLA